MNRPFWGILLLLSMLAVVSGCSSDSKSEPGAKTDPASPDAATAAAGGALPAAIRWGPVVCSPTT